jgi:hypothetical protein
MTRLPACQSGIRHADTWHSRDPEEQAEARAVCLACPTRLTCQAAVLGVERGWPAMDRHGVWAALDGEQRAALDPTAPATAAEPPVTRPDIIRENATWLITEYGYDTETAARQLRISVRHLQRTLAADDTEAAA